MKKTKAVHLSANTFDYTSFESHTSLIWNELSKSVDEYLIIGRSNCNKFLYLSSDNIYLRLLPVLGKNQFYTLLLIPLQVYFLFKEKPDYVISQCPVLGGISASIYKYFKKKVIVTIEIHGEHVLRPRGYSWLKKIEHNFFWFFARQTFRLCDNIRSLSPSMSNDIMCVYGAHLNDKIKLIPNRVDTSVFKKLKPSPFIKNLPIKIITVGAFSSIKNHLQLIKDLSELDLNYCLTIVGKGPLRNSYEELIANLGIEQSVKILENLTHDELAKEYSKSHIYIHYSKTEGFPRVILEAQACGLPVVTTNVGFINGVLIDKKNALILNCTGVKALSDAINFLSDCQNYMRISEEGYNNVILNFDSRIVFEKYRKLITGKKI